MSRAFWRAYAVLAFVVLLAIAALTAGPAIEGRFFPVRVDQRVTQIERTATSICWVWESYKARNKISDNLDLFIDSPQESGAVGAPYERATGMPWTKSRAVAAYEWHWQPYCVTLPPYVTATDTVRVRQTAYYPGLLGLWRVGLHLPDVVSAGTRQP